MKVKSLTCIEKCPCVARKASWGLKYTQEISDPDFKTGTVESDKQLLKNLIAFYCVLEGIFFIVDLLKYFLWEEGIK